MRLLFKRLPNLNLFLARRDVDSLIMEFKNLIARNFSASCWFHEINRLKRTFSWQSTAEKRVVVLQGKSSLSQLSRCFTPIYLEWRFFISSKFSICAAFTVVRQVCFCFLGGVDFSSDVIGSWWIYQHSVKRNLGSAEKQGNLQWQIFNTSTHFGGADFNVWLIA